MTSQTTWVNELKSCFSFVEQNENDAQVLILLKVVGSKLKVLLTQRSANLRHHANEWSLPGGKAEVGEDAFQTALRESEEEVGLKSSNIKKIGQLQSFQSKNELSVGVCICVLTNDAFLPVLNEDEVQKVIWLDLALINKKPDRTHSIKRFGTSINIPFYDVLTPSLWGLTAMILQTFIKNVCDKTTDNSQLQTLLSNK